MATPNPAVGTNPLPNPNETNGNFEKVTLRTSLIILLIALFLALTNSETLDIVLGIIATLVIGIWIWGVKLLGPNQRGFFTLWNHFTGKYTPDKKKYIFVWPIIEALQVFDEGMFTLNVNYEDLTFLDKTNAKGRVQLVFQIDPEYGPILYRLTGGSMKKEDIIAAAQKKLDDTVPAKLGIAVSMLGITEGYQYEEETKSREKDQTKLLTGIVKELLITHENEKSRDCFGLELLKVEIPNPEITGEAYEVRGKTKAEEIKTKLATAKSKAKNEYIDAMIGAEKLRRASLGLQPMNNREYADLRHEAEKDWDLQGDKAQIYYGLNNANPIVNVNKS